MVFETPTKGVTENWDPSRNTTARKIQLILGLPGLGVSHQVSVLLSISFYPFPQAIINIDDGVKSLNATGVYRWPEIMSG